MIPGVVQEIPLEEEYKKHSDISPQDVARLRDWLNTQPHLPSQYITDLDLILIYYSCDRSTEVTKQVLDMHYTLKTLFTSLFKDRVVDVRIETSVNTFVATLLPTRTDEGYACVLYRLLDSNSKNFVVVDTIKTALMVLDVLQYEEGTWPGLVVIVDLEGLTLGHLSVFDYKTLQQFFFFFQEAMLVKMKGLHFINAPSFMDKVLTLLKTLDKKSLMEGFYVHQAGSRTIDKFFPMDHLPKECGGTYKSLAECKDEILTKLKASGEYFEKESNKRVTESLRPGKPKTFTDFFGGIEGSFKKLDID